MAPSRGRIAILCGPGGNGGDGFIAGAAARILGLSRSSSRCSATARGCAAIRPWRRSAGAGRFAPAKASRSTTPTSSSTRLYGAGLSRDIDGAALALRRGDQRRRALGPAGSRRRCALRRRRRDRAGARRGGPGERERHVLSPQAGPSAAARARAVRPSRRSPTSASARPRSPRSRRKAFVNAPAIWRAAFAAARRLRPQIYARRGARSSPAPPIAPARRGWRRARRCASAPGWSTHRQPARRRRGQFRAIRPR